MLLLPTSITFGSLGQYKALFELNQSVSYKRMIELVIIWESLESLSLIILGAIICSDLGVGLESQPVDSVTSKKKTFEVQISGLGNTQSSFMDELCLNLVMSTFCLLFQ